MAQPTLMSATQNLPQIRHTSEVKDSEAVFQEISSDLNKAGLGMTRLLRIDNSDLKEKFQIESEQLKKSKQNDKDFKLNIHNLYHGTTAPLDLICDEGLDDRLSRRGRFGRGIYFSDNPDKCCKYAGKQTDEPYLLRCRVILGDIKEYPVGQQDTSLSREPEKGVLDGKRVYYDSVKGNPRDHVEYVVYERRRVLLEYIAFYSSPKRLEKTKHHPATPDHKTNNPTVLPQSSSEVTPPPRLSSGSPRSSCSGSSRSSSPGSDSMSPASSPQALPKVAPRRTSQTAESSLSSGAQGATASGGRELSSSSKKLAASRSSLEQQKLAFQQLLQLKGNIPEHDLNELIRSFTATYGTLPMQGLSADSGELGDNVSAHEVFQPNETVRPVIPSEDDPVKEVMRKLVAEFKEVTCCHDDAVCRQFIKNFDMDLNAAVQAYFLHD